MCNIYLLSVIKLNLPQYNKKIFFLKKTQKVKYFKFLLKIYVTISLYTILNLLDITLVTICILYREFGCFYVLRYKIIGCNNF